MTDASGLPALPDIQREPSLRAQVLRSLRFALFTARFPVGHTFSVPMLADEFGVSATPVREAVLDLVQRGLVEVVPAKGFRVVDPSPRTIRETVELRRLIEVPCTVALAGELDPLAVEELRAMAVLTVEQAEAGDVAGFVETDHDFHRALLAQSGNATLLEVVEDLRNRARVHLALLVAEGLWTPDVAREHVALVDALAAGDRDEAERVVQCHISRSLPVGD